MNWEYYRIVFKERGKPLHQISDMNLRFDALIDATQGESLLRNGYGKRCLWIPEALAYMWKCGFVHRDISAGNILLVDKPGVLADLEYAKPYSS